MTVDIELGKEAGREIGLVWSKAEGCIEIDREIRSEKECRHAQESIAAYRSMRADMVNVYTDMLRPLNDKRNVILKWKRLDLGLIDNSISDLSLNLTNYTNKKKEDSEERARKALEEAIREGEDYKDRVITDCEIEASLLEQEGLENEAHDVRVKAENLRSVTPIPNVESKATEIEPVQNSPVYERETYHVTLVDLAVLLHAVVDGKVSINAIKPNLSWLNSKVRLHDGKLDIPGVMTEKKTSYIRKASKHG